MAMGNFPYTSFDYAFRRFDYGKLQVESLSRTGHLEG